MRQRKGPIQSYRTKKRISQIYAGVSGGQTRYYGTEGSRRAVNNVQRGRGHSGGARGGGGSGSGSGSRRKHTAKGREKSGLGGMGRDDGCEGVFKKQSRL